MYCFIIYKFAELAAGPIATSYKLNEQKTIKKKVGPCIACGWWTGNSSVIWSGHMYIYTLFAS